MTRKKYTRNGYAKKMKTSQLFTSQKWGNISGLNRTQHEGHHKWHNSVGSKRTCQTVSTHGYLLKAEERQSIPALQAQENRNRGSKVDKNLQSNNLMQAQTTKCEVMQNKDVWKYSSRYNKSKSKSINYAAYAYECAKITFSIKSSTSWLSMNSM